jgi:gluconokinase
MSPEPAVPVTLVVMGVSGSGKTTLARALAERLGEPYAEGDALHPPANVEKMRAGRPLDDADRRPWLRAVAAWIGEQEQDGRSSVVTCSALKRSYRDLLRDGHPSVRFVHVVTDPALLGARVQGRSGHYMPASLLDSQLATLEPLEPDEPGIEVDGATPTAELVDQVLARLLLP